jgi:hypothetical protein
LPFVQSGQPVLAECGRRAEPWVVRNTVVTQGKHVGAILVDACEYLIRSAGGSMAGDEDLDFVRHENPTFLDQQRRMARSMRLMLDDPDLLGRSAAVRCTTVPQQIRLRPTGVGPPIP